ncbi:MAG: hypothetical protein ACOC8N_02685 [Spirochaetota bacterium]
MNPSTCANYCKMSDALSPPMVYAGIDEAGYGPLLGPLVITRCAFVFHRPPGSSPGSSRGSGFPCLWDALSGAVCRRPAGGESRLAVSDSKLLYRSGGGLGCLERGVLCFLATLGARPANLDRLLELLALDQGSSRVGHLRWYRDRYGSPGLPGWITPREVDQGAEALAGAFDAAGVRLAGISCAVVLEDRFNRMVRSTGNKAECTWHFVGGHLSRVWEGLAAPAGGRGERPPAGEEAPPGAEHGPEPLVVVDRLGGRKSYAPLLRRLFPEGRVAVLGEDEAESSYRITGGGSAMRVSVQVKGEQRHLPVALASMVSKYVRELLMQRFRGYWRVHAPGVRPTSGYYRDGRRFLMDIEPFLERLDIDPGLLVRER